MSNTPSSDGPQLRIWNPDAEEQKFAEETSAKDAPVIGEVKDVEDLLHECGLMERTVHPALLVDEMREITLPDYERTGTIQLRFYAQYSALLSAAWKVFGRDFQFWHSAETGNTFAYNRTLDAAHIDSGMEDVEKVVTEAVKLEQLIATIRTKSAEVLPADAKDAPVILKFKAA